MKTLRKNRKDIALTLELVRSVIEQLETGLPLIKRGHPFLLLQGQNWINKVPVGTYNSWRSRNTIPIDSIENIGLNELLVEARERIEKARREMLLKLGENGIKKILSLPLRQKMIQKRINKNGEEYARIIVERVNPSVVSAKLKMAIFAIERIEGKGRYANAKK